MTNKRATTPACGASKYATGPTYAREPWKCSAPLNHHDGEHIFDVPDPLCTAAVARMDGELEPCGSSADDDIHIVDGEHPRSHAFEQAELDDNS